MSSNLRDKLIRLVFNLVLEEKKGKWVISLGRVSFWLLFIAALAIWIPGVWESIPKDITPNHFSLLWVLALYAIGKKVLDLDVLNKKKEAPKEEDS